jgi:hypothetical protein
MSKRNGLPSLLLALACALADPDGHAAGRIAQPAPPVIRVGPHQRVTTVAAAALVARDGAVVEIEAGVFTDDVATWRQSDLTIRAIGGRARMISRGASAEGKAIWVILGNRVLIENIEFSGARVPDRNGAGIRHEGGKLTVRNCLFERNEMGLLTWNHPAAELVVEASEFRDNAVAGNHRPGDPIGHQLYVGSIARFEMRDSYIHRGSIGHLVKSRARENYLANNWIADERTGRSSYELEFPNGGIAYVIGNIIEQSAETQNSQIISFGAEGYRWPRNEFFLVNNTLVDDLPRGGDFLRVYPGADRVLVYNNLLLGNASLKQEPLWESAANFVARPSDVVSAATGDFRLRASSPLARKAVEPGAANGVSMRPERENDHPMRSRPVPAGDLSPGALQRVAP